MRTNTLSLQSLPIATVYSPLFLSAVFFLLFHLHNFVPPCSSSIFSWHFQNKTITPPTVLTKQTKGIRSTDNYSMHISDCLIHSRDYAMLMGPPRPSARADNSQKWQLLTYTTLVALFLHLRAYPVTALRQSSSTRHWTSSTKEEKKLVDKHSSFPNTSQNQFFFSHWLLSQLQVQATPQGSCPAPCDLHHTSTYHAPPQSPTTPP